MTTLSPTSGSPAQPLITLDGVSMVFGSQRVLHDLKLHIRRGQTLVIIGESGCGKTVVSGTAGDQGV